MRLFTAAGAAKVNGRLTAGSRSMSILSHLGSHARPCDRGPLVDPGSSCTILVITSVQRGLDLVGKCVAPAGDLGVSMTQRFWVLAILVASVGLGVTWTRADDILNYTARQPLIVDQALRAAVA